MCVCILSSAPSYYSREPGKFNYQSVLFSPKEKRNLFASCPGLSLVVQKAPVQQQGLGESLVKAGQLPGKLPGKLPPALLLSLLRCQLCSCRGAGLWGQPQLCPPVTTAQPAPPGCQELLIKGVPLMWLFLPVSNAALLQTWAFLAGSIDRCCCQRCRWKGGKEPEADPEEGLH